MPKLTLAEKKQQLDEILADLDAFKRSGTCGNEYALDANISFFKSLYSLRAFLKWLFTERPKLDGSRLLELSDFHLHDGKWERILQRDLLEIEQWRFPDLLGPLRKVLIKIIRALPSEGNLVLLNVGSGGMETERQIITALRNVGDTHAILFIGVDSSQSSIDSAVENLCQCGVPVRQIFELNPGVLRLLKDQLADGERSVVLCRGSALALDQYLPPHSVDVLYHSKLKHHIPLEARDKFDATLVSVSNTVVEYDNINGPFMLFVPIKSQWFQPILMNGAIFSCLRDPKRAELRRVVLGWSIQTSIDSYLRIWKSPKLT